VTETGVKEVREVRPIGRGGGRATRFFLRREGEKRPVVNSTEVAKKKEKREPEISKRKKRSGIQEILRKKKKSRPYLLQAIPEERERRAKINVSSLYSENDEGSGKRKRKNRFCHREAHVFGRGGEGGVPGISTDIIIGIVKGGGGVHTCGKKGGHGRIKGEDLRGGGS